MDNRQRNILIVIALILLYFYFKKKPAKKIETYPPYTGSCPYMLSEDRQTPTPFIDASTDYLIGSDPELKGDFKLYYWCCPRKMAVIVWQPFEDPIQYTNPEFDIQTGDNIVTKYIRYMQNNPNWNYDDNLDSADLRAYNHMFIENTMMRRILDAKILYCQLQPNDVIATQSYALNTTIGNCGTCSQYTAQLQANYPSGLTDNFYRDESCLSLRGIYVEAQYQDTPIRQDWRRGSMPVYFPTVHSLTAKPLETISINFEYLKDNGNLATYNKIWQIDPSICNI